MPPGRAMPLAAWQPTPFSVQARVGILLPRLAVVVARRTQDSPTAHRPPAADSPEKTATFWGRAAAHSRWAPRPAWSPALPQRTDRPAGVHAAPVPLRADSLGHAAPLPYASSHGHACSPAGRDTWGVACRLGPQGGAGDHGAPPPRADHRGGATGDHPHGGKRQPPWDGAPHAPGLLSRAPPGPAAVAPRRSICCLPTGPKKPAPRASTTG